MANRAQKAAVSTSVELKKGRNGGFGVYGVQLENNNEESSPDLQECKQIDLSENHYIQQMIDELLDYGSLEFRYD